MKIRLLIDAKLIGGTETHVMNLCQGLIAHKHDCKIIFIPFISSNRVATYHAGEPAIGRLILYNCLDRWTSILSNNIAVNTQIAKQLPSPAEIIPNFVDMPKHTNPIKNHGPYNVYFIGRFSPEKDPLTF